MLIGLMIAALSAVAKEKYDPKNSYSFLRGTEALTLYDLDQANEWYQRELADHPDNGYAYLYLALLNEQLGEYGKGLTAVNNAIKYIPKKDKEFLVLAWHEKCDIHLAIGDNVQALDDLYKALKIDSKNTDTYEKRADIFFDLGKYDLADLDYEKMLSLDPGNTTAYMGLGRNAKIQEQWDQAIEYFNKAIRLSPENSSGYSFRAEALIGKGKYNEALDDIMKALSIDGDQKAYWLMRQIPENYTSVLKTKLKIQMAKEPSENIWPFFIGDIAERNGDVRDALIYYEKANQIDPDADLLYKIADCYNNLGNHNKALQYIDEALSIEPEDETYIMQKAEILEDMGRLDESIGEWGRLISLSPDSGTYYFFRGCSLMNAGRFKEAIEDYNTAADLIALLEEVPVFHMYRGDAYRLSENMTKAKEDYNMILTLEQDSTLNSDSRTPFAYSGLGQHDKAVETMQTIVRNDTADISGNLYNLACAYARANRNDEAIATLKDAVEHGYDQVNHMNQDYDLINLRQLPAFKKIVKELKDDIENDASDSEDASYTIETVEVPFTKENGITKVKCTINDLPLHFYFDTGAADVTISMVEANFMLKNDYIKPSDIIGTTRFMDANGDISEGTVINLRNVNFGGLQLDNVRASVVRNQKAPLLLGQTVLGRLGKIEINNNDKKLIITHKVKQ